MPFGSGAKRPGQARGAAAEGTTGPRRPNKRAIQATQGAWGQQHEQHAARQAHQRAQDQGSRKPRASSRSIPRAGRRSTGPGLHWRRQSVPQHGPASATIGVTGTGSRSPAGRFGSRKSPTTPSESPNQTAAKPEPETGRRARAVEETDTSGDETSPRKAMPIPMARSGGLGEQDQQGPPDDRATWRFPDPWAGLRGRGAVHLDRRGPACPGWPPGSG